MTDYVGVMLNGLCTGLGVILAQKLWYYYEHYSKRIKKETMWGEVLGFPDIKDEKVYREKKITK